MELQFGEELRFWEIGFFSYTLLSVYFSCVRERERGSEETIVRFLLPGNFQENLKGGERERERGVGAWRVWGRSQRGD